MDQQSPEPIPRRGPVHWLLLVLLHLVLPAALLFLGYLGMRHLMATAPSSTRKPHPRVARAVEVVPFELERATPILHSMGVVVPAREVVVRARVGGAVESVADCFQTGGRFTTGDTLLQIERADFELAVARATAAVNQTATALARSQAEVHQAEATVAQRRTAIAEAEARLSLERGNQEIARREFEMLGGERLGADRDLALRAPQLAIAEAAVTAGRAGLVSAEAGVEAAKAGVSSAEANLAAARVGLRNAELDEERTTVEAPFNAWIRQTSVEVGSVITSQSSITSLVGSDVYWVEVTLPLGDLGWLRFSTGNGDDGGARVTLRDEAAWGPDGVRKGRLVRLLGDLEESGRLARLLVEVDDPLDLETEADERHPLLVGSYVKVEIEGAEVGDVVLLERSWLRHGDVVWVADAEDRLRLRSVEITWRGRTQVFVARGLEAGDRVITTDLAAPVDGMPLRVRTRVPDAEPEAR